MDSHVTQFFTPSLVSFVFFLRTPLSPFLSYHSLHTTQAASLPSAEIMDDSFLPPVEAGGSVDEDFRCCQRPPFALLRVLPGGGGSKGQEGGEQASDKCAQQSIIDPTTISQLQFTEAPWRCSTKCPTQTDSLIYHLIRPNASDKRRFCP
jgi:hypothetical protein